MATGGVKVKGLRETTRAFNKIEGDLTEELTDGLKQAAEPVRAAAEKKAVEQIRNMPHGSPWAEQQTVVSKRTALAYIRPAKRATRNPTRKRKNLADLLMGRAMEPALQENEERVKEKVEDVLDRLGREAGF